MQILPDYNIELPKIPSFSTLLPMVKNDRPKIFFIFCTIITISLSILIMVFILYNAWPVLQKEGLNFIIGTVWDYNDNTYGIFPFIIGTLILTITALILACPLSIFTAIFMAEFAPTRLIAIMRPMIELLIGIPSVVYGFFGLVVLRSYFANTIDPFINSTLGFIPIFRDVDPGFGIGVFLASTVLAIMILPTITVLSEEALRSVPKDYKDASYAIGATKWETIKKVTLPSAYSGILTAVILGTMRAMGETMAIVMLMGNRYHIPTSILDTGYAMTSKILNDITYYMLFPEAKSALFGIAAVLFVVEFAFLVIAKAIGGRIR